MLTNQALVKNVSRKLLQGAKDLNTMILHNLSFLGLTFCSVSNLKNCVTKDSDLNRYQPGIFTKPL